MISALKKYSAITLFCCLACFYCSPTFAQESSVVSAMLEEAGGNIEALDQIIHDHEALLNKYPDSEFAPTLLFQLAELHNERSQLVYQQALAQYEKKLAAFSADNSTEEPTLPILDMTRTIDLCSRLLEGYPKLDFRNKVMYKLAAAYLDVGLTEPSKTWFERLVAEFPDSPAALEAHFRIGEFCFDLRQFEQGVEHYRLLLNHWDNPYFSMALYKLGWSYYNLQRYSDAISTFLVLIEDMSLVANLNSRSPMASKTDLTTESIHYIADSFTEFGGPATAKQFLTPLRDKEYTSAILLKISQLYESRGFYRQAIDNYRVLLDFYPFTAQAPNFYRSIVKNYEAAGEIAAANQVREEAVRVFGPSGVWAQRYPQGEMLEAGLQIVRDNLCFLGTFYQAKAQQTDSLEYYQRAIDKYQEYIDQFPAQENSSEIHYYLAESFYAGGDFLRAAEAYFQVATRYPNSSWREKAAFNRIFSFVQLKQTDTLQAAADTLRLPAFLNAADTLVLPAVSSLDAEILISCNDFCKIFPSSGLIDQVCMKFGQTLYELDAFLPAVQAYTVVMQLQPPSFNHGAAAMNAGQSYFDGGYFEQARDWFTAIARESDSPDAGKARRLAASAQFKIAESLSRNGKSTEAAFVLLTVAGSSPDTLFQARALFEAALQYQKADSLLEAARTFERLALHHPSSELSDKALYQAAAIRERLGDWPLAAADYSQLVESCPASSLRQQALKNAELCYENAQNWIAAKNACRRIIELNPNLPDEVVEFSYKSGDMAQRAGQTDEARQYFLETVNRYAGFVQQRLSLDPYYAAGAQFMFSEILFLDYKTIELTPPFETNLKRKMNAFTDVVKGYGEAIKFQIADWTTAALFRIGESFEELSHSLVEAPIPESLSEEQRILYQQKLGERARPYQEKALETYQKNITQAEANQIDNQWVTSSRLRAEALRQELQPATPSELRNFEGEK